MLIYIVMNVTNEIVLVCNEMAELLAHLTKAPHHQVQIWNTSKNKRVGGTLAAKALEVIAM